jgi:hypothetical protein
MPVIEAQRASILVPRDHRHINHDRTSTVAAARSLSTPKTIGAVQEKGSLAFRLAAVAAAAAGAAHGHAQCDHGDGEQDGEGAGQVEAVS